MGCGCRCGNCPNAFDLGHLEAGEGEVASPVAAMFELGELEQERGGRRGGGGGRSSMARPQFRRTSAHRPPGRPAGPRPQMRRMSMGHAGQTHPKSQMGHTHPGQMRRMSMGHAGQTHPKSPMGHTHPGQMRRMSMGHAGQTHPKSPMGHKHPGQQSGNGDGPDSPQGSQGGQSPGGDGGSFGGRAMGPNPVFLNRRYADRLGWRAYFDPIVALLGPDAAGGEEAFVQAVAQWQATQGLPANGVLDPASWAQMQGNLAADPDPAPLGPPPDAPAPLPPAAVPLPLGDTDPSGGEMEWESESAFPHARPASRRWAPCPPSAEMPPTERTVLAVTSQLETGKPFACTVWANDGISMGLIRWNLQNGTLQRLLARYENQSGRLIRFFGHDYDRLMGLIALRHSAAQRGRAVAAAHAERLADHWRGPLLSLFSDATFYAMLMQDVRGRIAAAKGAARRLGLWTVRGLALLFDIAACEGLGRAKIARLAARLRRLEATKGPLSEQEKLVAVADESVRRLAHHRDARRARRLVIATGSGPARGQWWDLHRDYPNLDAPWES
jgi:hypothetical protein